MARVAVAYVEVRPDTLKFAELLRAKLAAIDESIKVKVEPETAGLTTATRNALKTARSKSKGDADKLGKQLGVIAARSFSKANAPDPGDFVKQTGPMARDMKAAFKVLGKQSAEVYGAEFARQSRALQRQTLARPLDAYKRELTLNQADAAERAVDEFAKRYSGRLTPILRKEALKIRKQFNADYGAAGLTASTAWVKSFNAGLEREAKKSTRAAATASMSEANAVARNATKQRLVIENEAGRALRRQARAEAELTAQVAAEAYVKSHVREWAKRKDKVAQSESRALESSMLKEFGPVGRRVAQTTVKSFNRDIDRRIRESGRKSGRSFAQSFGEQLKTGIAIRLGRIGQILALVAVTAAPLAQLLSAAAAALVSLASAAVAAGAALGASLGVGLLAAGQAAGTAAFAMRGFGDALKALAVIQERVNAGVKVTQGELDNYAVAMAKLSPAARQVVTALGAVNGQLTVIRRTVSQALFADMGAQIQTMATRYLPVLQEQLTGTARMLNTAARGFTTFAAQASTVARVRDIMAANTQIMGQFMRAVVPLTDAALTLVRAFQPLGLLLAQYVTTWARGIRQTTAAASTSGRLAAVVDLLAGVMRTVLRIAGNVAKALVGTFNATLKPGLTLLAMFDRLVRRWTDWTNSVTGQSAIAEWAVSAIPIMQALGRMIGDVARMFGYLAKSGDATTFVDQLRQVIPPLQELLHQLSASGAAGAFATGMATALNALAQLGAGGILADAIMMVAAMLTAIVNVTTAIPPLTWAITVLISAMTALAAIRLVATLTGFTKLPAMTVAVINFSKALRGLALTEAAAATNAAKVGGALSLAGGAVRNFSNGVRIAAIDMGVATGAAATLRAGVMGVSAAIAANPVGALLVGVGLVVTAIWAISAATKSAETNARAMNLELAKVGAKKTAVSVADELKKIEAEQRKTMASMIRYNGLGKEVYGEQVRLALELTGANQRMAADYGSQVETIIGELRARGVAETTSTAEILVAMDRIKTAHKGQVFSAEQMTEDLANIYGVMVDTTRTATAQVAGYVTDAAAAYSNISQAAIDAAIIQGTAAQMAAEAMGVQGSEYYLNSRAIGQQQAALKALQKQQGAAVKVPKYTPPDFGKLTDAAGPAKRAGAQTAAGWITSFNAAISDMKASDLLGKSAKWTAVGKNIADYLAKGLTSGAKNIANVSKYISKTFGKTYVKQIQDQIKAYNKALTYVDPATGKKQDKQFWEDRLQAIKDFKSNVVATLTSGADLVNYFGFVPTPSEVKARLDDLLRKQQDFTAKLAALQAKGLSDELAAAWLQAGYDTAGNLVEGLQDATKADIDDVNKTFKQIGTEAQKVADAQALTYFKVGQTDVEKIIAGITSKTATAEAAINTLMAKAVASTKTKLHWTKLGEAAMDQYNAGVTSKTAAVTTTTSTTVTNASTASNAAAKAAGEKLGKSMMEGYQKGIKDQEKQTSKVIKDAIENAGKAGSNAQKSKSPSKLWADIGMDAMAGYMLGITSMQADTVGAVNKVIGAVAAVPPALLATPLTTSPAATTPGYATPGAMAGVGATPPQIDVRVFIGERELTDIVSTQVDYYDSGRARMLLAGRRGG